MSIKKKVTRHTFCLWYNFFKDDIDKNINDNMLESKYKIDQLTLWFLM